MYHRGLFRQLILVCMFTGILLLSTGCGVYSKVPPINPETDQWEGPLLEGTDLENVQITIQPEQKSIILNLKDIDADLSVILQYLEENQKIEHTFAVNEQGSYVLVLQKQE